MDWLLVFVGACILLLVALWVYRPKPPRHRPRRERSDLSPPIQRTSSSSYVDGGSASIAAAANDGGCSSDGGCGGGSD